MEIAKVYGMRVDHFGMFVYDLEESIAWYKSVFGYDTGKPRHSYPVGMYPKMRTLRLGNFKFEVYEAKNAEPYSAVDYEYNVGVKHFGFSIRDYEGWVRYAREKGVDFLYEYHGTDKTNVYIRDNTGIVVEVMEEPVKGEPGPEAWGEFGIRPEHVAIHVTDLVKSTSWYESVLGFSDGGRFVDASCAQGQVLTLGAFRLELYEAPTARPFTYVDYEYNIGVKHFDVVCRDRYGWLQYVCEKDLPARCVVSNGPAGEVPPEVTLLPHYLLDPDNMLVEISDEFI